MNKRKAKESKKKMQHKESKGSGEEKEESKSSRNSADGVGIALPMRGDGITAWHQLQAPSGLWLPQGNSPSSKCHQFGFWSPFPSPAGVPSRAAGEDGDGFPPRTAEAHFCLLFWFLLSQAGWAEGAGCPQPIPGVYQKKKKTEEH